MRDPDDTTTRRDRQAHSERDISEEIRAEILAPANGETGGEKRERRRKQQTNTSTLNSLADAETLLDALAYPAFVVDTTHTVVGYNDGLATLLGIDPEDRVGEDARESIAGAAYTDDRRERSLADKVVEHPRCAATEFDGVERVTDRQKYAGEHVYEDRSTMHNERGEESLIGFVATPIFDDGKLLGALELVEKRDPGSGEFAGLAGILAHDLRNPLEVAQTFTELAADDIEDSHHDRIQTNLDRMADIIDDTMTLYRQVETEREEASHNVARLAEQAWETVDTAAATLETATATVRCDRTQLVLLFEKLFRNAVEHGRTENGTDSLTITVGPLDTPPGFYVADSGTGIPPDERQVVLEHGFSTSEQGTGLGLTIVQQIARNHDWALGIIESDSGGARFEFQHASR